MCYHIFEVLLPYEFLLEQNYQEPQEQPEGVLLPYEFLLEQNGSTYGNYNKDCFVTI